MSNIATTPEKSKHLLELGLDPKTADMSYSEEYFGRDENGNDDWCWRLNACRFIDVEGIIPAWSLSALLEVMPMVNEGWPVCCKIYCSEKWHVLYHSTAVTPKIDSGEYDTPIEAAYELVCCLLEQGLIKKEDNDE